MSFIRTGLREVGLKIRRQRTRLALRHQKRILQRSEIALGREGCEQASSFPEVRTEIVALKKLEQEQKEVTRRISQIEENIQKIDLQRQQNSKEQTAAIAKLEEEKKPFVQRRNGAKAAADICERELAGVDRRLQENDSRDRDLLQRIADLQAQVPAPADLDAKIATISAQRARLPDDRAELTRAQLGSINACKVAREKLAAAESELSAAEKNISRVLAEHEARDRVFNENSRAQLDAVRELRTQHDTVEERKNPAYLNIGRHLATHGIAPPNAPHLLGEVHKHRTAVIHHSEHREQLAVLSSEIDKQELRKFYFVIASVLVLLSIILPLVFQTPPKREWLPQATEDILSLKTEAFDGEELAKRWRKEQPEVWQSVVAGLTGAAQKTPGVNLERDVVRVTRAMSSPGNNTAREYILVETRRDASRVIRSLEKEHAYEQRPLSGLPVWHGPEVTLARVGSNTLAIGAPDEVEELVRVRLGISLDLKITGQLYDRLQALDRESAVRLISRDPVNLPRVFHPIFQAQLLQSSELLGLGLTFGDPVRARLLLKTKDSESAARVAESIRTEPRNWLGLEGTDALLYTDPAEITRDGSSLEVLFAMPENSARLLLQRVAKTDVIPAVATQAPAASPPGN